MTVQSVYQDTPVTMHQKQLQQFLSAMTWLMTMT